MTDIPKSRIIRMTVMSLVIIRMIPEQAMTIPMTADIMMIPEQRMIIHLMKMRQVIIPMLMMGQSDTYVNVQI